MASGDENETAACTSSVDSPLDKVGSHAPGEGVKGYSIYSTHPSPPNRQARWHMCGGKGQRTRKGSIIKCGHGSWSGRWAGWMTGWLVRGDLTARQEDILLQDS